MNVKTSIKGKMSMFLVLVLLFSIMIPISGCEKKATQEKTGGDVGVSGSKNTSSSITSPFTLEYQRSKEDIKFFAEAESYVSFVLAGPLYAGRNKLPGQKTEVLDLAREKKVKSILDEREKLISTSAKLQPLINQLRSAFFNYIDKTAVKNKVIGKYGELCAKNLMAMESSQELSRIQYVAMKEAGVSLSEGSPAKAYNEFLQVNSSVDRGRLMLEELENLAVYSAFIIDAASTSEDGEIKAANAKLTSDLGVLDQIKTPAESISDSILKINNGIKQLETADYYMGRAANAFMLDNMAKVKEKTKELSPVADFDQKAVDATKAYVDYFDKFITELDAQMAAQDKSWMVEIPKQVSKSYSIFPIVYGDSDGEVQLVNTAYTVINMDLNSGIKKPEQSMFSKGLGAITDGVKATFHAGQTAVGLTLDYTSTAVTNVSRVGTGLYYGNSVEDIWDDMKSNAKEIGENYRKCQSGSKTLKTASEYMDDLANKAGNVASSGAEYVAGKGYTSAATGWVAKTTVGCFTSLSQGIYAVANRQSSTGDIAIGAVNIGTSFIGGSTTLFKTANVPGFLKGMINSGTGIFKGTTNVLKTMTLNAEKKELLSFAGREGADLISNKAAIEGLNTTLSMLEKARAQTISELTQIAKNGASTLKQNATTEGKKALEKMFEERFQANFKGLVNASGKVLGETPVEYIDNLMRGGMDDYIKELAKKYAFGVGDTGEGTYQGIMKLIVKIPTLGDRVYSVPLTIVIKEDGTVEASYTGKGTLKIQQGISLFYNSSGTLQGDNVEGKINASGNSEGTVTISAGPMKKTLPGSGAIEIIGQLDGDRIVGVLQSISGENPVKFDVRRQSTIKAAP